MERIKRQKYSREFKAEAVKMVESGRQQAEVARELGITGNTLWNWVERARKERETPNGLTAEEREELRKLRREVADLREEREILKKATAFFAKYSK